MVDESPLKARDLQRENRRADADSKLQVVDINMITFKVERTGTSYLAIA